MISAVRVPSGCKKLRSNIEIGDALAIIVGRDYLVNRGGHNPGFPKPGPHHAGKYPAAKYERWGISFYIRR